MPDSEDLDLNLLHVLVAMIEAGGVTTAAARLGLSQPAVSLALAKLRASLGSGQEVVSRSQAQEQIPVQRRTLHWEEQCNTLN